MIALFALISSLWAAPVPESRQLFFPIEKNAIQILPQRFEYQMVSPLALRLGDEILNAGSLSFQFGQPKANSELTLVRFKWSGVLFLDGDIVLLDSTGKALWRRKIDAKSVKRMPAKRSDAVRFENFSFESRDFPVAVLDRIRLYPFFRFCLTSEADRTHVLFCSRDQYIKIEKNKQLALKTRSVTNQIGQIEINGQAVDPQGFIFLEGVSNPINLHARFPNGATLDIETRQQKVEFRDITRSENGKHILIKAVGAEPVDPKRVRKTGPDSWVAEVDLERPHLYMKGAAGIPMKQEFVLSGPLRPNDLLLTTDTDIESKTYNDEIRIRTKRPKGWLPEAQEKSRVEDLTDQQFTWVLERLDFKNDNRRFLKMSKEGQSFFAAAEAQRFRNQEYTAVVGVPLDADISWTRWWPGFRWGSRLDLSQELMKLSSSNPKLGALGLEALWTFDPAILDVDPQTGLSFGVQNLMIENSSHLGLSVGSFTRRPTKGGLFATWGESWLGQASYTMGLGSGDTKLKSSIQADLMFEKPWENERRWLYGVQLKNSQVEFETSAKNLFWFSLRAGISGIF